jgi:hypothetical protein
MIYPVTNIIDGQPCFEKPIDEILADIKQEMLACKQGQSIEVKRKRRPTSQKQRGNTFGNMVKKIRHEANEVRQDGVDGLLKYLDEIDIPKGVEATPDFVMKVLYTVAPTFNGLSEEITLSKMDTKQAADFFKRCADAMAGYVYIPDPNPEWQKESGK